MIFADGRDGTVFVAPKESDGRAFAVDEVDGDLVLNGEEDSIAGDGYAFIDENCADATWRDTLGAVGVFDNEGIVVAAERCSVCI